MHVVTYCYDKYQGLKDQRLRWYAIVVTKWLESPWHIGDLKLGSQPEMQVPLSMSHVFVPLHWPHCAVHVLL